MSRITQYQLIYDLCSDGQWHCNADFWALFSRSPHKRRSEMVKYGYCKAWLHRPCEHGLKNVKDHFMLQLEGETLSQLEKEQSRPAIPRETPRHQQGLHSLREAIASRPPLPSQVGQQPLALRY